MEAPEAALDPFRTVSLGFLLNRGTALPRWTWRRPGPSLGRGKFLRYPAPASRHFTPLYIAYVTKQLSTCCVQLILSKKVFNSPRSCSIAYCLHVMCTSAAQNRSV